MDYYSRYIEQINNTTSPNYDKYMDIYYSKDPNYERFLKDKYLILIDKKKKKEIVINHGEYINLYSHQNELKKEYNSLINTINIDFDKKKEDLIKIVNELNTIKRIFQEKEKLIDSLYDNENKLNHDLYILYSKRKKYYDLLPKNTSGISFNELKKIYVNEQKIDDRRIELISKKLKLNVKVTKIIFNWFIVTKKYINLQDNLNNEYQNNKKKIDDINNILNNFILIPPKVDVNEFKKIKLSSYQKYEYSSNTPISKKDTNDSKQNPDDLESDVSEDEGSEDEGSEGSEDEGSEDDGSEDEGSEDEGSEGEGSEGEGSEDDGSEGEGSEDDGSEDDGSEDEDNNSGDLEGGEYEGGEYEGGEYEGGEYEGGEESESEESESEESESEESDDLKGGDEGEYSEDDYNEESEDDYNKESEDDYNEESEDYSNTDKRNNKEESRYDYEKFYKKKSKVDSSGYDKRGNNRNVNNRNVNNRNVNNRNVNNRNVNNRNVNNKETHKINRKFLGGNKYKKQRYLLDKEYKLKKHNLEKHYKKSSKKKLIKHREKKVKFKKMNKRERKLYKPKIISISKNSIKGVKESDLNNIL